MVLQKFIISFIFILAGFFLVAQHNMPSTKSSVSKPKVAILFYENLVPFDYVPSMEIFRAVGHYQDYIVFSVGNKKDSLFTMFGDIIIPAYSFAECPKIDVLVIGGGNWDNIGKNKELVNFVLDQYKKGTIIYSICTGAYVLAQLGLLDNIPSTSIHFQLDILKKLAPKTKIVADKPYVDNEQIITAAGAATAIEAALHIVERLSGAEKAKWLADVYLDYPYWPVKSKK